MALSPSAQRKSFLYFQCGLRGFLSYIRPRASVYKAVIVFCYFTISQFMEQDVMFEAVKEILPRWELQIAPEKIQRGDSINYFGCKIDAQKIGPQKVQIRRDRYRTLNDLQKLLGEISQLQTIIGVEGHDLKHLKMALKGDKDLNSPRVLSAEAEKELEWVEKRILEAHVDHVDPKLDRSH